MAPIVPTYRPLVTPTRTAIAVALVAVMCSVFLALGAAQGRTGDGALSSRVDSDACAAAAFAAALSERVSQAEAAPTPLH